MVQEDLDFLLYRWLSEPDEGRSEEQFTRYFRAAFPTMCRYMRSLHTDATAAEDIAQQALIKFFHHFGRERRVSDQRLRKAISALRPLDFGALHVKQVNTWRRQVNGFRDAAIGFRICRDEQAPPAQWNDAREEINERIPLLRRQGTHFIGEVRARIGARLPPFGAYESPTDGSDGHLPEDVPFERVQTGIDDAEVERFLSWVSDYARSRAGAGVDTALGCVGAHDFLTHTSTVRSCLPRLEIPSNRLLYTIAKRQLIDRLRSTKYQAMQSIEHLAESADDGILGVLEGEVPDQCQITDWAGMSWVTAEQSGYNETEIEVRYRGFLEFLRAPLTRAEGALAAAATKGKAKAAQARVESLRSKYDRLLSVLAALQDDPPPTEEQIARREGLSRNQVKYVIERIREEFNHFFPDLARQTDGRRRRQGGDSAASEAVRAD